MTRKPSSPALPCPWQVNYQFYGAMPADVPHRVVAGCHTLTNTKVVACWRLGALVIKAPVKALVRVEHEQVVIQARAPRAAAAELWLLIIPLFRIVADITRDFPGLQGGCSLTCPLSVLAI